MKGVSVENLLVRIKELESQLLESEQLIEAIKCGEVDAFAINNNGESEIYTIESADYAYRLLVEECGEGSINVSEEGLILYANSCFLELLNLPLQEVIGSLIFDFIDAESSHLFRQMFETSLSGKSKGEINFGVNGRTIPVYISLTSIRPKLASVGMIVTDFSEKRKTEKLILEYQKNLESKNSQLERNNEELASFVYIASHDLQEPLRKIQTFASRLLDKETDNLSETGKDNFDRMQIAAKRMQTLIEDLLVYSRTSTMERNFENINLGKIADEVKMDLMEDIQEKRAIIETTGMCVVRIIPFQFKQIFCNLISNSLKFSYPTRIPHITIKAQIEPASFFQLEKLDADRSYCHISFSDNGIGFEQKYDEKIFKVFVRLNAQAEYAGTGIGLAIVKKIVENHHGVVTVTSELDKGTTFDIYIPVDELWPHN